MGKLKAAYADKQERHQSPSGPPDPDSIVVAGLHIWRAETRLRLPPPCPTSFEDAAVWWRTQMQEPEKRGETFLRSGSDDSNENWDCGYAVRLRSTLLRFIAMSEGERSMIVAAREDKVFWRGEEAKDFAFVIDETMEMRRIGVEAYRIKAMAAARRVGLLFPGATDETEKPVDDSPPKGSAEWYAAKTGTKLPPLLPPKHAGIVVE